MASACLDVYFILYLNLCYQITEIKEKYDKLADQVEEERVRLRELIETYRDSEVDSQLAAISVVILDNEKLLSNGCQVRMHQGSFQLINSLKPTVKLNWIVNLEKLNSKLHLHIV